MDFPSSCSEEEESNFPSLVEDVLLFFFFSAWTYSCRLLQIIQRFSYIEREIKNGSYQVREQGVRKREVYCLLNLINNS